jgi:hypothetical protein
MVLIILSGGSCVRENRSDCPPLPAETLKVSFSLLPTDLSIGQGREYSVALYLFDSAGRVFDVWSAQDIAFGETCDTGIVLGADTYELVAWMSLPDAPFGLTPPPEEAAENNVDISIAKLELAIPPSGVVDKKLPWLFYGAADELTGASPVEVVMVPENYVVNLSVTGLPDDGSTWRFAIRDNNGAYDFRNNYLESEYFTCSSAMQHTATGTLGASLTTLRIDASRSPAISLVSSSTGEDIFPAAHFGTNDLVRIIMEGRPENDFRAKRTYNIDITYTGTSAELRVDGWALKPQDFDVKQ